MRFEDNDTGPIFSRTMLSLLVVAVAILIIGAVTALVNGWFIVK